MGPSSRPRRPAAPPRAPAFPAAARRRGTRWAARLLVLALAAPHAASQLPFDLVELTLGGHPDDPGIAFTYRSPADLETEAGGVAVGDFDEDGRLDLYLPAPEGDPAHLYVALADGTYVECAAERGVAETPLRRAMAAFLDFDNDGDLDLLTAGQPGQDGWSGPLLSLFRNDGPPGYAFTDVTASAGGFPFAATVESSTVGDAGGLAVADYDRDGFLDFVVTWWENHFDILDPLPNPPITNYHDQPRLFRSRPNPLPPAPGQTDWSPRVFTDDTIEAGLDVTIMGLTWMPGFTDVNRDGWPDLHLCIESGPDQVRLNDGTGRFGPDVGSAIGLNLNAPHFGNEMGYARGDLDGDGDLDWLVTSAGLGPGRNDVLYRNDSLLLAGDAGLHFTDASGPSGVWSSVEIGWGAAFVDLDLDRDLDLVTARGLTFPVINTVRENRFPALSADGQTPLLADVSDQLPGYTRSGMMHKDILRSLVAFDHDGDGDLDLFGTRSGWKSTVPLATVLHAGLYRNTLDPAGTGRHWLAVDLRERAGSRNVVGTRVWVASGGPATSPDHRVQEREVVCGDSFLVAGPDRLHFGLGAHAVEWIVVRWTDGTHSEWSGPMPLDEVVTIAHGRQDATGDLDGDGVTDCADVALFDQALVLPTAMDAQLPDRPWRILADVDGNGVLDAADRGGLGLAMASPWCEQGGGVAGTHGLPRLDGAGDLLPGSFVTLTLSGASELSYAWTLAGFSEAGVPLNGGTLVPTPDVIIGPFATDAGGELVLAGSWPPSLPSGIDLWLQSWIADGAAPWGFSASHGVRATTP